MPSVSGVEGIGKCEAYFRRTVKLPNSWT